MRQQALLPVIRSPTSGAMQPGRNDFILTWAEPADIHMTSIPSFNKRPQKIRPPEVGYGKDFATRWVIMARPPP